MGGGAWSLSGPAGGGAPPDDVLVALGLRRRALKGERRAEVLFDTEEGLLFRAGAACLFARGRRGGLLRLVPVSRLAEVAAPTRTFVERVARMPSERPLRLPGRRIADLLRETLHAEGVTERAEVETLSRRWQVFGPKGLTARVEVLSVRRLDAPEAESFTEVRLVAGTGCAAPERLEDIVNELAARSGLAPDGPLPLRAILERMFPSSRLVEGPDLVLRRDDGALEALRRILRRQWGQMIWNEPGARLGLDAEALHDMRVAVRRMRAALRVFAGAIPSRRRMALARELRWLGDALGAVRDLDVSLLHLRAEAQRLEPALRQATVLYEGALLRRRERARRVMLRALDSARYRRLAEGLRRRLDAPAPARPAPEACEPAPRVAVRAVRKALGKVLKMGRALPPDAPDEALHRLRIACKRLRYACEFFGDLLGAPAAEFAARVKEVQDVLGAHQDAVVFGAALSDTSVRVRARGDVMRRLYLALGTMAARHEVRAEETRREFLRMWRRFDRRRTRKALKAALRDAESDRGARQRPQLDALARGGVC